MNWEQQVVDLNELKAAVGECIHQQRNGYDALASAAWDNVVRIWEAMEKAENERARENAGERKCQLTRPSST